MKKFFMLVVLAFTIFSCSKKITPAKAVVTAPVVAVDSVATISTSTTTDAAVIAAGQTVYVAKCGKCHGLKDPANYTQERWVGLVNSMAPRAKATDEEKGQILAYVQHNAKDAVK